MRSIFESIARENFKSSGYFMHPGSERRTEWQYTNPPRSPFNSSDTASSALLRRESAQRHKQTIISILQNCVNVFFRR
ncbi:MAG: hypothetical protein ACI8Z5_000853 [Lentimonas sp.]|jgi:hypothetical protein